MEQQRSKSLVQEKSFSFALNVVDYVRRQRRDFINSVLVRQLLRSGTSIGANVEEALGGHSRKDFIAKLSIAAKEARETRYWLRLIRETHCHSEHELPELLRECDILIKMLNSIILTTRQRSSPRLSQSSYTNSECITQNSEPSASPNSDLLIQASELKIPNSGPITQNS